jgi:hypothetical protein
MRTIPVVVLMLLLGSGCTQQKEAPPAEPQRVVLTGYIVDAMCGNAIAKKTNPMEKAARHTRACGLAEACAAEGYGVFADGRWIVFDEQGNALANAALRKDTRERALYFRVEGTLEGDHLAVTAVDSLPSPAAAEVSEQQSPS